MDLVRFGLIIRALRRRKGWRQLDLAVAAGVSQALISLIERSHADEVLLKHVMAVIAAVEARGVLDIRWHGGELDRLLDQDHAAVGAAIGRVLTAEGWVIQYEVTYSIYGAHGSIDLLAWHSSTASLLVIEIKTEVTSAEATIRKLDEKVRLAAQIARERFGWKAATVARFLIVEESTTARRRVSRAAVFDAAFPMRAVEARRWLRTPRGAVSALMFLPSSSPSAGMSKSGRRHRIRTTTPPTASPVVSTKRRRSRPGTPEFPPGSSTVPT